MPSDGDGEQANPTRDNDGLPGLLPARDTAIGRRGFLHLAGVASAGLVAAAGLADGASTLPHTITFDGTGSRGMAKYAFEVSEAVEPAPELGELDSQDKIDGTSVRGKVDPGDTDGYRFAGDLTQLMVSSDASVSIVYEDPANTLEILTAADVDLSYAFTTSGKITKELENGDLSAETANDTVVENADGTWTATGRTGNGYGDTYHYAGEVLSFSPRDEDANGFSLRLNGNPVTTYELTGEEEPTTRHHLELLTDADADVSYGFTATGLVEMDTDNSDLSAESYNDSVVEDDAGTWTATGATGNGYGDSYYVEGSVTAFSPMDADAHGIRLRWDGDAITTYELTGEARTPIVDDLAATEVETDDGDAEVDVEWAVSDPEGDLDSVTLTLTDESDGGTSEDATTVSIAGGSASGTTRLVASSDDGAGHTYGVEAVVTDTNGVSGSASTSVEETEEADASSAVDGGPIGGGEGYEATVDPSAADVTVSTADDLERALNDASAGDVVYVYGGADIYWGSRSVTIPSGVTLASDRGIDGAPGGHVHTDQETEMFQVEADVRVTGLRIQGKYYDWVDDYGADGEGVEVNGSNVEVDNCEIWGFADSAIQQKTGSGGHYHHNDIHHNPRRGLGYGVAVLGGDALIEWCRFENNRHSVAGGGDESYEVRYCWHQGPEAASHVFDMHSPGGETVSIHHNTIEATDHEWKDKTVPGVAIRDVPNDIAEVHHNWFYNGTPPRAEPNDWTEEAIIQVHVDEWTNVDFWDNHYGTSEPSTDIGHPR